MPKVRQQKAVPVIDTSAAPVAPTTIGGTLAAKPSWESDYLACTVLKKPNGMWVLRKIHIVNHAVVGYIDTVEDLKAIQVAKMHIEAALM